MHLFFSPVEGQAGCGISHSIDSQCFVWRFLCLGDSNSLITLYSKRLGEEFCVSDPFGLPLFCFGNSVVAGCSPKHTHLHPQIRLHKRDWQKATSLKISSRDQWFQFEIWCWFMEEMRRKFSCPGDFVCFSVS